VERRSKAWNSPAAWSVGASYRQALTGPRGRPIRGDARSPRRCREKCSRPARPEGSYVTTEDDGRFTVRFTLDLKPAGLMEVLDGIITKTMRTEVAQLSG
jgi:hypothetical protein